LNWPRSALKRRFHLLVAADRPEIHAAADRFRAVGADVTVIEADLATTAGVDRLWTAAARRPIDALLANAGHGLGHGFLDQDFNDVRHVVDTNVTGTIYLVQLVGRTMRSRKQGRILLTGSIAGFMPDVARVGFDAMMRGDGDVVSGWRTSCSLPSRTSRPPAFWQSNTGAWPSPAQLPRWVRKRTTRMFPISAPVIRGRPYSRTGRASSCRWRCSYC